jgi:Ion channel
MPPRKSFVAIFGAAIALVIIGTITYTLGESWNVADGFYFAVCTLTTSSIADPDLTLTSEALKIFTTLYVLTGIGILVELARQLGVGFVKMREEHGATRHAKRQHASERRHKDDPPGTQSPQ